MFRPVLLVILVVGLVGLAAVPLLERRLRLVGDLTDAQVRRRRVVRTVGAGVLAVTLLGTRFWMVSEPGRSGDEADRQIAAAEADLLGRLRSAADPGSFTTFLDPGSSPLAGAPITSAEVGPHAVTTRTEVRVGTVTRCLVVHVEPGGEPRAERQDGRCSTDR